MKNPKSVITKSQVKAKPAPIWGKVSFHFNTTNHCNDYALTIAIAFRSRFDAVYFARYNNTLGARLDLYLRANQLSEILDASREIASKFKCVIAIKGPTLCPGSEAHAAGFDAVIRMSRAFMDMPPEQGQEQFMDVLHWTFNMMGYDYVNEARCHLYSIERILSVFDNSIRLGQKLDTTTRKQRRKGASRN